MFVRRLKGPRPFPNKLWNEPFLSAKTQPKKKKLNRTHYFTARTKSGWRSTSLGGASSYGVTRPSDDGCCCCGGVASNRCSSESVWWRGKAAKTKEPKIKNACSLFFFLQPPPSRTSELFVLILCFGLGFIPSGRGDLLFWPGTKKRHDDGAKGRGGRPLGSVMKEKRSSGRLLDELLGSRGSQNIWGKH